jgi:hypothetical protein
MLARYAGRHVVGRGVIVFPTFLLIVMVLPVNWLRPFFKRRPPHNGAQQVPGLWYCVNEQLPKISGESLY